MKTPKAFILAIGIVVATTACAGARGTAWTTHRDSHGFIVSLPPGWSSSFDGRKLLARFAGSGDRVAVRAAFAPHQALAGGSAIATAEALARDTAPSIAWGAGHLIAANVAQVRSRSGRGGIALLVFRPSPAGTVLYFYEADANGFSRKTAMFRRIFQSFRIARPQPNRVKHTAVHLSYVHVRERSEGAFTVDLPRGWRNDANLNRMSVVDIRPSFIAIAPDGTRITSGDRSIPFFTPPNAMTQMGGLRIGSPYRLSGVTLIVEPYIRGQAFAQEYVRSQIGHFCSQLRIESSNNDDRAVAPVLNAYHRYGLPISMTAGEVYFSCVRNGKQLHGYVFAGTQYASMGASAIWNVQYLLSYLAPASGVARAQAALRHAAATFRMDPGWSARSGAAVMATSRAQAASQDQIAAIIDSHQGPSFGNRSSGGSSSDAYDDSVRGVQHVQDPDSGGSYTISNRYAYNWINHSGDVVGTDTSASPGVDFRSLLPR